MVLDGMPVTENGQIDRRRLRTWAQNVNDETYDLVQAMEEKESPQPPGTELEKTLQRLCSQALSTPPEQLSEGLSFTQLGGDEEAAAELVTRCKRESIYLKVSEVTGPASISELVQIAASRSGGLSQNSEDEASDAFDLSPMQHLYFRSAMGGDYAQRSKTDGSYRFNQSLLFRLNKEIRPEEINVAIEIVVNHHPMLRARFFRAASGWTQRIMPPGTDTYALRHHHISSDNELEAAIEATQAGINIEAGPVFAVDYFSTNDGQQLVYLAAHHLVVDLSSWRLIMHDLDELLQNGALLSQATMPFGQWIAIQKESMQHADPASFLPFDLGPGDYAYWGMDGVSNTYGDASRDQLHAVGRAYLHPADDVQSGVQD